ncbi:hypothetical protein [Actinomadura kijaniata]|uniref:hypothetical protein n=1 Tax=Actinomadura kijaniata TaxID=46161 RepID=UPI000834F567|nr:hypothetical protein [Actinomadura kijaniata]
MGFVSVCCLRCHHPLLSPYSITPGRNDWMGIGVSITPDHQLQRGTHDGYGRLNNHKHGEHSEHGQSAKGDFVRMRCSVWHEACWELDGRPTRYQRPSVRARDQGYFFAAGSYDLPNPRPKHDHQHQPQRTPRA